MKVELNQYLVSRIEKWKENWCIEPATDLLKEVADAIANQRVYDENHIEDVIDSIS